jgi:hypothetical protein
VRRPNKVVEVTTIVRRALPGCYGKSHGKAGVYGAGGQGMLAEFVNMTYKLSYLSPIVGFRISILDLEAATIDSVLLLLEEDPCLCHACI